MKTALLLAAATLLALSVSCSAQTSDYPGGSDMRSITRPANSFLIGALHIDNDEYEIPVGPVGSGKILGKAIKATGPVDTVAYAGPKSASSFTTYGALSAQLLGSGFVEVWSCVRQACGNAYDLANLLWQPLVDSIQTGLWGNMIIDDLGAANDDIRYGAFRKGAEYVLALGALSPGHNSGALLVRVNGPADDPVLREPKNKTAWDPRGASQGPPTGMANVTDMARSSATTAARSLDRLQ